MPRATPVSMLAADLDGDGVPDLIAGYGSPAGGVLAFYRGNLDAFAPQTSESFEAIGKKNFPSPFLAAVDVLQTPVRPDLLASVQLGDSNSTMLFVAARGSPDLYIYARGADGRFENRDTIDVGGAVTALRSHDSQIVVGIHGRHGSQLVIYSFSASGLSVVKNLPIEDDADELAFGDLDGDGIIDVAVLAGGGISEVHGRDFHLQKVPAPFMAYGFALGAFIPDRDSRLQIAAIGPDGNVHFLAHHEFDPRPWSRQELRALRNQQFSQMRGRTLSGGSAPTDAWQEVESVAASEPFDGKSRAPRILRGRISGQGADDLILLDATAGRLLVISHPNLDENDKSGSFVRGAVSGRSEQLQGLIGAISERVNVDGRPGLLLFRTAQSQPLVMMPLPDPTFYVNRFDDPAPGPIAGTCNNTSAGDNSSSCSLREAVRKANATVGVDTIMAPAGTITLGIAPVNGEHLALHGHLDILDGVNIVGAGPGSTIIQAGPSAASGIDKIFSINPNLNVAFDTSISNLTLRYGLNPFDLSGDGTGGAFDWDSHGTGNLAVTNCVISNNATTNGYGGGIAATWSVAGTGVFTISNSVVQNNTSARPAPNGGFGGGLYVGANQPRLAMTNTQVLSNRATGTGGAGGGLFLKGPAGALAIHDSVVSGNSATGNGGGIESDAGMTIDQGTTISGNNAVDGGGIWNSLTNETTTLSQITITGNSASGNGGGLYLANNGGVSNQQITFSRLANNGAAAGSNLYSGGGSINATDDWWGSNSPSSTISGSVTYDPFIVLTNTVSQNLLKIGGSSTVTASFTQDNHGASIPAGNLGVLTGLPVAASIFPDAPVHGSLSSAQSQVQSNGAATETFTAVSAGTETIHAAVDNASIGASITILSPPSISLSFADTMMTVNATTSLTFTITNPNAGNTINGVAFTDALPAGLAVATPNGLSGSCGGGAITSTSGSSNISLSGAALPANGSCTFTVKITGTVDAIQTNTTGNVTSTDAGTGNRASASITVINPPNLSNSFGGATVPVNVPVSLTFTVSNPNFYLPLTSITFVDALPLGLLVNNPSGLSGNCGGVTAMHDGQNIIMLNGSLAPNSSCTFTVNVVGNAPGQRTNVLNAGSSGGNSGDSVSTITVVGPATLTKSFSDLTIPLNASTTLTFTVANKQNATVGLTSVGFADNLPAGLTVSNPNGLSGGCNGGIITATPGSNIVTLANATVPRVQACAFSVSVTGAAAGVQNNTTGPILSFEGGSGATASASVTVVAPPSITTAFGVPDLALNSTTSLSFTITNPAGNTVALTGVGFTDTLPVGLTLTTGTSSICGGTLTISGGGSVALSSATIATNSSCKISLTVTGSSSGSFTNTTSAVTSANGGTGNAASANIAVASPPTIATAFFAAAIPLGGSTSVSYTIGNPIVNTIPLTGVTFTDTLPAGLFVSSPNGLTGSCGGGAVVASNSTVSLSGATIPANGGCTFSVNVTGLTAGLKANLVSVSSTEGGPGNTSTAALTVVAPPAIAKSFGAVTIPLNGSTSLRFTLANPNFAAGLTGVGFTDNLPAGLSVASPNGLSGSCGGSIIATEGANSVSISGVALAAGASCTSAVNVTGALAGPQNNTTSAVASVEGGTGSAASAAITVLAPPSIAASFGVPYVTLNATTLLNFTITNPSPNTSDLTGIAFVDTLPAGLSVANGTSAVCGGTLSIGNGTTIILSGATVTSGAPCTFSVIVKGVLSGVFTNSTGAVTSTNGGTGNSAPATLDVASPPVVSQSFGAATIPLGGLTSLNFTIVNPAINGIALTGVALTDNLPSGLVVSSPNGLTGSCGGGVIVAGNSTVSLSGAIISTNGTCAFSVNVTGTLAGLKNNSGSVTSTEGGPGNASSANLVVVAPPTIIKSFGAGSIPLNTSTSLSFTVTNPNAITGLTGIGFSDPLPAGLVIATPNGLTGSCGGGVITATEGGNAATLSGAALAAGTSCTFSVNATGTTPGPRNNSTGAISSVEGGAGAAASATVNVVAPPALVVAFGVPNITLNGSTTLSFTITNPSANTATLTGVAVADTLPAGLTLTNGTALACGGTLSMTNGNVIALSGATVTPNETCTFSVSVKGNSSGVYTNTCSAVTSTNGGTGNSASATLSVASPPSITQSFGALTIPLGGATTLSYTIANPSVNAIPLTGVAFADNLPPGLVVSSPNGLSGSCGNGTIAAGNSIVSLSAATIAANGSCIFGVDITAASAGLKNNSVSVTSTEGGPGNTSSASLTVIAPPMIAKSFGAGSIPLNDSTTLSFTITNPNATAGLTGIAFSDPLPSGLVISTPNGLAGACGNGTITATAGGNSATLSGAALAAGTSCTFAVNVTGTTAGPQTNTTGAIASVEGGTGGAASATLNVVAPPAIVVAFGAPNVTLNGSTTLTFTITNPSANTVSLTGVAVSDSLPAGLSLDNGAGLACGGTLSVTNGTTIALSGATVAVNVPCIFSESVKGGNSGVYTNTSGDVTSTNGGTGNSASATLSVASPPSIIQSFGAPAIPLGGSAPLSYTITNPSANAIPLTGVAFIDNLPTGLVVSSPNGLSGSCGSGVVAAGNSSVSLSAATIPANGACTFSVNVTGTSAGVKNNSASVASTEGGPGNTSTASLTVVAPPTITEAAGSPRIPLSGTTSLTFSIANPNAATSLSGIAFDDTLPPGLAVAAGATGSCGSGTIAAPPGANSISLSGATLPANGACTFSVNVSGLAAGVMNNSTGPINSNEGGTGGSATASLTVVAPPAIAKSFGSATIPLNGSATLSFSIVNPNTTVPLTGINFADPLPQGLIVSTSPGLTGSCSGTITTSPGSSTVAVSGVTLNASSSCSVTIDISATTAGTKTNTTSDIASNEGGTGAPASATLQVTTPVTFTTLPAGLSYSVDGNSYTTAQTLQWMVGSSHSVATVPVQPGAPGTQYSFTDWSDTGALSHVVTAPAVATTYTANFGTQYQLTLITNPPGGGTTTPGSGSFFDSGQTINLTAAPATGFLFVNWGGQISTASGLGATALMDAPKTIVANFRIPTVMTVDPPALTVQYDQSAPPSVTSDLSLNGNGPLAFSATASVPWISVTASGFTPATVPVNFNLSGLAPGNYSAIITFQGIESSVIVPVTVIVTGLPALVTTPTALSFNALPGSTTPQTQDVLLTSKNHNLSFSTTTNAAWLSVSFAGTLTPINLHIKADPSGMAPGAYQAAITVSAPDATNSPVTIPITLVIGQSTTASPAITGVINAASYQQGEAAPNTILSLFGSQLCLNPQVVVGGTNAEILAITPTQINFVIPDIFSTQSTAAVQVVCDGASSQPIAIPADSVNPALFTASQSGTGPATILNNDFTVNGPSNPALRGLNVAVYGTGFGALNPAGPDGLRSLANPVTAFIGDVDCQVLYAGEAPGYTAGLQQIDILIPFGAPTGVQPLRLVVEGVNTQQEVTIAVE